MTQQNLIRLLAECCENNHLSYRNLSPKQVSPGIWRFYAVEMDDDCSRAGHCRQMSYYARELNGTMVLC